MESLSLLNWEQAVMGSLVYANVLICKGLTTVLQGSLWRPQQRGEGKRAGTESVALAIDYKLQALEDGGGYIGSFEQWGTYCVSLTLVLRGWCRGWLPRHTFAKLFT